MANAKIIYTPEGGSRREWVVDLENPDWDIQFGTEKATGWAWVEFAERLENVSAVATRALIWVLRKRTEPKLHIDSVEVPMNSWDIEILDDPSADDAEESESGEA